MGQCGFSGLLEEFGKDTTEFPHRHRPQCGSLGERERERGRGRGRGRERERERERVKM